MLLLYVNYVTRFLRFANHSKILTLVIQREKSSLKERELPSHCALESPSKREKIHQKRGRRGRLAENRAELTVSSGKRRTGYQKASLYPHYSSGTALCPPTRVTQRWEQPAQLHPTEAAKKVAGKCRNRNRGVELTEKLKFSSDVWAKRVWKLWTC